MALHLTLNGEERLFVALASPVGLLDVVESLALQGDRIAIEHNGKLTRRTDWAGISVESGDRLEIVHFVGGGSPNVSMACL